MSSSRAVYVSGVVLTSHNKCDNLTDCNETERPCDDVPSTSTDLMTSDGGSNVGIFTGVIGTLVLMLMVMGSVLVVLTWKIIQYKRKPIQQYQ